MRGSCDEIPHLSDCKHVQGFAWCLGMRTGRDLSPMLRLLEYSRNKRLGSLSSRGRSKRKPAMSAPRGKGVNMLLSLKFYLSDFFSSNPGFHFFWQQKKWEKRLVPKKVE